MSISLQTIKTSVNQEIPTIYLQIETKKYLFNIPDAFQRFRPDHKINNLRGPKFFFSRLQPQYINGLFGFSQTLFSNENLSNGSQIFGPPNIKQFLQELKQSIIVGYCLQPYSVYEFGTGKYFNGINKEQIQFMQNKEEQKEESKKQEIQASEKDINNPTKNIGDNTNIYKDEHIQIIACMTQNGKQSAISCFIGVPNKIPGKVDASKLDAKGIKGKERGILLQKGELILSDGTKILADDFKDEDQASPCFLILDIQDISEIDQLEKNDQIQNFYSQNIDFKERQIQLIIHLAKPEIVKNEKYQSFMRKLVPEKKEIQPRHIFTSSQFYKTPKSEKQINEYNEVHNRKQAHMCLLQTFNQNFPNVFEKLDILNTNNDNKQQQQKEEQNIDNVLEFTDEDKLIKAWNYYQFILKPLNKIGYQQLQNYDLKEEPQFVLPQEEIKTLQQTSYKSQAENIDPFVTFLGTGSMCPSRLRNVSGILIENQGDYFLFDCGEGTYCQLIEKYGQEKTNQILKNLKSIIITHSHSDHHLGFLHLLHMRKIIFQDSDQVQKVFVTLPACMGVWYKIYSQNIENLDDFCHLVFNQQLNEYDDNFTFEYLKEQFKDQNQLDLVSDDYIKNMYEQTQKNSHLYLDMMQQCNSHLYPIPVEHCPQAYGIISKFYDKSNEKYVKITYSGDTRPCETFIKESQDADIMIHEGTFNDELQKNAESHGHSTIREAVTSAIKANAKQLIITHFSQRYSKIPKFDFEELNSENIDESQKQYLNYLKLKTVFAFDQLSGKVSQFWDYGATTWFIAKNLNIDKEETEETEQEDDKKNKKGDKKQQKKQKK
ncbi:hypothetical protein PPERSA_12595 [Pseudocohnilembus persalinus]|uniref:ribonuclease Z n=1 Tax=Pseudocohnilembus persalinus TaxID=266149 RepID=A0A0V0QCR8_PSEPJ|nr:hypothetical protein PPERSA_12595 [Pseudocohnilembus persalinus]|eukprot:KRW99919.1 hypothetical protein PPERSA_12595 [Pseudocohnilembus persalinus]